MESIQITGNKARFDNYLTSPLTIPENGKVCLNKASFSIPVWTQKYVNIPKVVLADRGNVMLTVSLNGVSESITWTDFYNAWDTINVVESRTPGQFYNGKYKLWFNNIINFIDAGGTIDKIPGFTEILAEAFDTKFDFYNFISSDVILPAANVSVLSVTNFQINGVDLLLLPTDDEIKNFGLTALYAPEKVSGLTPVTMDQYWTGADFTRLGDNITLTGNPTSYAIAKNSLGNVYAIDPNGGYWNFRMDLNNDPGYVVCGVVFTSLESKPDTTSPTTVTEASIEIGIKFSKDGALHTFQAVDGMIETPNPPGPVEFTPNLYPNDKIFTFDNDVDEWFIQIRRAAGYESSSNKFIFRLLHGDINNAGYNNAECFYQSEFTLPSPDILAVPIIYSNQTSGGAGTNEVKDNFIINVLPQSLEMGDGASIFSDRALQILPDTDNGSNGDIIDFFSTVGLSQNARSDTAKVSFDSSNFSNKISWNFGFLPKLYFVGVNDNTQIFKNNEPYLQMTTLGQSEIPRQMEVSLLNLAHTPYAGSFAMDKLYTNPDINKVISYINTDAAFFNSQTNVYLEYVYEAFNLVGRRLKNRSKLPLNQFVIQIGYKNFLSNEEQVIHQLRGVCKMELLFDVSEGNID